MPDNNSIDWKKNPVSQISVAYEEYRKKHKGGWGLAWYLAAEVCERFYASHGIVPYVICHDGLGYYGIQLDFVLCKLNPKDLPTLGRFTAAGNVENWITGGPGDHGLKLVDRAEAGESLETLLREAIAHLRLPPYPEVSHATCRHRRRGSAYVLVFKLFALLALRHEIREQVWNHANNTEHYAGELDPKFREKEHPGYFLFQHGYGSPAVLIAGDGRVLLPEDAQCNLWERYMQGESLGGLLCWLEEQSGLTLS